MLLFPPYLTSCISSFSHCSSYSSFLTLPLPLSITLQWDKSYFPTPIEMQRNVSKHGRKMVTIIDPHLKRDENYYIHKEASSKGLYVKNKDGGDFDGWCWPGQSSYLDFTSPKVVTGQLFRVV